MAYLAISLDYDSPAGYRMSRSMTIRERSPDADMVGTRAFLRVLSEFGVQITFGVVGEVADQGDAPDHCPDQIREIHAAGHEIASHSMGHQYLPALRNAELAKNLTESKRLLETCLGNGAQVRGLIPPFNQPRHFPRFGCISVSEKLGLGGVHYREHWDPGRQSIGSVIKTMNKVGYGWIRIQLQSKWEQFKMKLNSSYDPPPRQPFLYRNVVALPLHAVGFGDCARDLIRRYADTDLVLFAYGHPNQGLTSGHDESAEKLGELLHEFESLRDTGKLTTVTMGEAEQRARAAQEVKQTA